MYVCIIILLWLWKNQPTVTRAYTCEGYIYFIYIYVYGIYTVYIVVDEMTYVLYLYIIYYRHYVKEM